MPTYLKQRILPIHAFLGDQEGSESITLAQIHSSGGSENVYIDKMGSIQPIAGYRRVNATAVTGGDGPFRLVAIYPYAIYQSLNGELVTRQTLIGVFQGTKLITVPAVGDVHTPYIELYESNDGGVTWTNLPAPFLVAEPPGFTDILSDSIVTFAQIGDILVITGPTRNPMKYVLGALDGLNTLLILDAPTVAVGAAATLNGNYRWRVIDVLTDGTRAPARPATELTNVVDTEIVVSWDASVSPLIKNYEIYRTTGNDTVYFYAGQVPAGTLTFTDALGDLDLIQGRVLQEHGDAPPFTALCAMHGGRMWYGQEYDVDGNPMFPRRAYWSDPGRPDSVYKERSFVDFSDGDSLGDKLVGLLGDYDKMLVGFLERSIWRVTGTGQYNGAIIDYERDRCKAKVGSVSGHTVLRIPAGAVYTDQAAQFKTTNREMLAYLTPNKDIRLFDGDNAEVISFPLQRQFRRMTYSARHRSFAILDDSRSEATWFIPVDGNPQPNIALTWNYKHGVWFQRPAWDHFASALVYAVRDLENVILAGEADLNTGGFMYLLWDGHLTADGDAIIAQWMSKSIYGPARPGEFETAGENFSNDKRFRWADIMFWTSGLLDLEVAWLTEEADDDADPISTTTVSAGTTPLLTSDGEPILTSDGEPILVSNMRGNGVIRRAFLQDEDGEYYHGRGVRLRIRGASGV